MTYREEYSRIVDRMRIVDPQCKEKCSREKILENFDWCMENCQVIAEDHNLPRDALWVARRWLEEIARKFNVDPKYVYELDPYLQRIRLVKHGDIILPEDHNSIVEALRKLRDVLEKIERLVYKEGYEEGYEKGYEECYEEVVSTILPVRQVNTVTSIVSGTWAEGRILSLRPLELLQVSLEPRFQTTVIMKEQRPNTVDITIV